MRLNKQATGERERDHRRKRGLREGQEVNGRINRFAGLIYSG